MIMTLVDTIGGYDFYVGRSGTRRVYNIVPHSSKAPRGGYLCMEYIEKIKGVKFPDRYQSGLKCHNDKFSQKVY